ncbi:MTM1 (YGR257C) [Zygosaccharomyces parabailii]|uniref:ZYBA0S07-01860g1_1 n=1 Tax=Zygosaccharomyces bailii (strain CLIB 213 / ATCC 58445 / CBS 680 / BCRC 21525 / NBRC 1098 / NCYC 1416 / NRRL Y-2227) TaxID=1333698 RepID=A0A8J2TAD6_ZYGB2|nr:MTM1 (YGR257C) [Zygosaccharomyces parabailii]CDF90474.1 ZYBA0S07-01860g1_1 [Zygosaccharomyces bailii CLIB 213]CDH15158.1 probable MTM1-Mitochondrial manganese carrier-member of the mitochondrial carrier (MCF) family [Zygosaccharomyces bailii ISA1307]
MGASKSEGNLTFRERMLSAGVGSLLTSLILTPMDVVRIRLQQQEVLPRCSCPPSKDPSISITTPRADAVFWQDPCFHDVNCKNTTIRFNGTLEAFTKIAKSEGATSLWSGISISLLMAIPANVIYFTGYEYLRDASPFSKGHPTLNPLVCGAFARVIAATMIAPLELIKTRLQSIPRSSRNASKWEIFRDLMMETRKEISEGGGKVLFRGLEITLWRDVPFSATYWATYEFCKNNFWYQPLHASTHSNWIQFGNSFITGCISGSIAAILTHPFDVGKTRMQIAPVSHHHNNSLRNIIVPRRNMFAFLNGIRRSEGLGALYVGLSVRVAKVAPSCAIMISSYEVSKRIFSS